MASVDILFVWASVYVLYDRKMIKYLWLGSHNSVNFTGKESNEEQLFLQVPVPVFCSHSRLSFP